MTVTSAIFARLAKLPPARRAAVAVERDVEVKMPDGAVLLADRWYPLGDGGSIPTVVLRTPYGRRQMGIIGRLMAERGYMVLIESVRGTFGSGGEWLPFRNERADGRATLDWLAAQPWFGGQSATFGPSYLGLTQWAVAGDPPDHLGAMALDVTASAFREMVYPGGTFSLETGTTWIDLVEHQELPLWQMLWSQLTAARRAAPVFTTLPLSRADEVGARHRLEYYQDWLVHERAGDPWWDEVDFGTDLSRVPPATLVGGWYDLFLPSQVADYVALRAAGRQVRLTIGPWTHTSPGLAGAGLRDGLEWFDERLLGRQPARARKPVRLFVLGARRWVEVDDWPPPAVPERWHLHRAGRLAPDAPGSGPPDRFRYDPATPTPAVGGASLNMRTSGRRRQRKREARADVLTYSSEALAHELTVAGPLSAEIWLRSSRPHTDVFVRLCDVDERGRSVNISDGIRRLEPDQVERSADGTLRVRVSMWPTAITFLRGHRIRLQVSSGAHPLYARNPGGGERLGEATDLWPADQEVFHDPEHPSAIELPISPL